MKIGSLNLRIGIVKAVNNIINIPVTERPFTKKGLSKKAVNRCKKAYDKMEILTPQPMKFFIQMFRSNLSKI